MRTGILKELDAIYFSTSILEELIRKAELAPILKSIGAELDICPFEVTIFAIKFSQNNYHSSFGSDAFSFSSALCFVLCFVCSACEGLI